MGKLTCGVGINDADYNVRSTVNGRDVCCRFFSRWKGMLNRCYNKKLHEKRPTYKDCSVCDEWLVFSNFKAWMQKQSWEGMELDKDIINPGNKVYSPDNCAFITKDLNCLLIDNKSNRGENPRGVCWDKSDKRFIARVRVKGRNKRLGVYFNYNDASKAYIKAKVAMILEAANEQTNHRVANGLRLHAKLLLGD